MCHVLIRIIKTFYGSILSTSLYVQIPVKTFQCHWNWIIPHFASIVKRIKQKLELSFVIHMSGVPQGSHLVSTFFFIFINDISGAVGNDIWTSLFADRNVAKTIRTTDDAIKLQNAVIRLQQWCTKNKFYLNNSHGMLSTRIR